MHFMQIAPVLKTLLFDVNDNAPRLTLYRKGLQLLKEFETDFKTENIINPEKHGSLKKKKQGGK